MHVLGPNEDQRRTLKLAASTAFMSMAIIGLLGIGFTKCMVGYIHNWCYRMVYINEGLFKRSLESAASVKWSGLWPKEDEQ